MEELIEQWRKRPDKFHYYSDSILGWDDVAIIIPKSENIIDIQFEPNDYDYKLEDRDSENPFNDDFYKEVEWLRRENLFIKFRN